MNQVILDTGSPDLWIALDSALPGSKNTSLAAEIDYGTDAAHSASIEGDVFLADVEFGGFSIPNQAYSKPTRGCVRRIGTNIFAVDVANVSSSISTGLLTEGVSGLIGLSPSVSSSARMSVCAHRIVHASQLPATQCNRYQPAGS